MATPIVADIDTAEPLLLYVLGGRITPAQAPVLLDSLLGQSSRQQGLSGPTANNRLHKGRRRLRKALSHA
jgi:hypothetical protein